MDHNDKIKIYSEYHTKHICVILNKEGVDVECVLRSTLPYQFVDDIPCLNMYSHVRGSSRMTVAYIFCENPTRLLASRTHRKTLEVGVSWTQTDCCMHTLVWSSVWQIRLFGELRGV